MEKKNIGNCILEKYLFKVGNIQVEMEYANNNKDLNECILNIMKQKYKMRR